MRRVATIQSWPEFGGTGVFHSYRARPPLAIFIMGTGTRLRYATVTRLWLTAHEG